MELARGRTVTAFMSLAAGLAIFAAKVVAWLLTGSTALLADASESVVNVVAAAFALWAVRFGARPVDEDHPYGHGKVEYLAAAFEGGLVAFAGLMIVGASARAVVLGVSLRSVDLGLAVAVAAAVANLLLGAWVLARGKRLKSSALIADGHHVLSDVWTTGGSIVGLALASFTGITWLDPLAAIVVALLLLRTGAVLVRSAVGGLLDEEDPELVGKLTAAFAQASAEGFRELHRVRAIRAGDTIHVDAHVYVPAAWSVEEAHERTEALCARIRELSGVDCDLAIHLDPESQLSE